jgi:hypothetical protein
MSGIQPQRLLLHSEVSPLPHLENVQRSGSMIPANARVPRSAGAQFFKHGRKEEEYG